MTTTNAKDEVRHPGKIYSTKSQPKEEPDSLTNEAYHALRTSIISGTLKPGHFVVETDIASQLNMSRTPVHEAVIRLQNEGFVRVHSRRGVEILRHSPEEVRETYQILAALEGTVLLLLASERQVHTLDEMDEATNRMEVALSNDDLRLWAEEDDNFHRLIIDSCGNERLRNLATTFYDLAHWSRMSTLYMRPKPVDSVHEHRGILKALREGEGEKARSLMDEHRRKAGNVVFKALSMI